MHIQKKPLYLFAPLLIVCTVTAVVAAWSPGDMRSPTAVVRLRDGGRHDLQGRVVRCVGGETAGILVEGRAPLTVANAVVEGCQLGVMVTPGPIEETPGEAELGPAVRLMGVRVHGATIGIWLAGNGGSVSGNIVGDSDYGVVITGDDYTVTDNQSNDNRRDGFLVTGDRNVLEGNEARRNGGVGIHVASMVPMIGRLRALLFIRDQGLGNRIRDNTALGNGRDLAEFAEDCEGNDWAQNTFESREPECLQ